VLQGVAERLDRHGEPVKLRLYHYLAERARVDADRVDPISAASIKTVPDPSSGRAPFAGLEPMTLMRPLIICGWNFPL